MERFFLVANVLFALMMRRKNRLVGPALLPVRIDEIAMKDTEREMIGIVHLRVGVLTAIIPIRIRLHGGLVTTRVIVITMMITEGESCRHQARDRPRIHGRDVIKQLFDKLGLVLPFFDQLWCVLWISSIL
jgi:hypothetical protein